MFRRNIIIMLAVLVFCTLANAQKVALKNNLLLDGMASVNLGVEFKTGTRTTIDLPASYNLWSFSDSEKFKHIAVQPEFRWWMCQPFSGHFFGLHGHYASFNVGGIGPFKIIKNNRYEGWLAGAGVSYGYSWILAPKWSIEATASVGYAYMSYDKYKCGRCQPPSKHRDRHYFGPTKLGISVIFLLK